MNKISIALSLFMLTAVSIFAQEINPRAADDGDVVKITTKLVQLDAVVTDKDNNQVTNLSAADFEVYQDGKPQKITGFSYVAAPDSAVARETAKNGGKNAATSVPPVSYSRSKGGRIITFIVDDGNCTASQSGMFAAREALEKFVNQQMLPNDSVAIYQTRGGSSLLQQYTSDKGQLMRVVRKIRWLPVLGCGRGGEVFEAARADTFTKITPSGTQSMETESENVRKNREANEDAIRDNQILGAIGVMRYVIRGLDRVGGRKTIFLLSDGIPLRTRDGSARLALDALRDLTDLANRASVVFNTIDVRGSLNPTILEARDEVLPRNAVPNPADATGTDKIIARRVAEVVNTQNGLFFLANETGGRFYYGQNFLDVPIRRALNLERGYYLLAYAPEEEDTFKSKNFNKIEIKVKRPELKVFSRAGFFGRTDDSVKPKKRTGDSELYEAIVAPLPHSGLSLRLTSFFGNSPNEGNYIRSLIHLDGREIAFTDEPNGYKKAVFDVVAVTLDEKNQVIDEFTRTHTFKVEAAAMPLIERTGLVYSTDISVKKDGVYNFRVAVRDATSKTLGSAAQIVQVPDLKKKNLFLSGLNLSETDAAGKFIAPSAVKPENAFALSATTGVPAIRQFKRGTILAYSYTLYNASLDKTSNQPKLTVQTNLFRDGKLISEGRPQPAELESPKSPARIDDYGYLRLNPGAQTGDYALQVIVRDLTTNQSAAQWIDFEVTQ